MPNKLYHFQNFLKTKRALKIVLVFIILINALFYLGSSYIAYNSNQSRRDAVAFSMDKAKEFIYFYYYTGYFPLATLNDSLDYSINGAQNEIERNGKDLIMEYKHWARLGENARMFAFLPNAYLKGSPKNPSIKLFNCLVFIVGLLLLFWGFWRSDQALLGFFLVVLIQITPFFHYEVYRNENVLALLGAVFFMVLGLNAPVLFGKRVKVITLGFISVCSGFAIGFISEIRNEVSVVLSAVILIYVFSNHLKLFQRIGLCLFVFLVFKGTKEGVRAYFKSKFKQTTALVSKHNGHVYNGKIISGHRIWHNVFCGLGDFDTKYGYEWNDRVAYKYAVPVLKEKYNINVKYSGKLATDNYYDKDSLYYIKFDEIEEYDQVVLDKVVSDITNDPFWYVDIIFKRIVRIISITIPVPFVGWLVFPLVFLLWKEKSWNYIKLIVISLPLAATSLIVYSGKGSTYNSVFVYFVIALWVMYLLNRKKLISNLLV